MAKQTIPTSGLWSAITNLFNLNFDELFGRTGWGAYQDTEYTDVAPFAVTANTDTILPNNAGSTIDSQKPTDVTTFYDGSVITGRNGDGISITLECTVEPASGTNTYFEIWVDIGGGIGKLYPKTNPFVKGVTAYNINVSFTGYTLNTWEANGGTVYVRSNTACDVYNIRYVLTRTHKAR